MEAGYTAKSANAAAANASCLLRDDKVAARVRKLRTEQEAYVQEELLISREVVMGELQAIMEADVRDLVAVHYAACRYCWGKDHEYQWCTRAEFEDA